MSLFATIAGLFAPVADLVDELHTSDEERLTIKAKVFEIQTETTNRIMDYERALLESQTKVITAEAQGASWLQRNWRPITMLTFLVLIVCDSFGLLTFRLSVEAWALLKLGLGGYVVGRTVEKVIPQWNKKEKS